MFSPKTICLMSDGFHLLPMMPLGWSWASAAQTLIEKNSTCRSKRLCLEASLWAPPRGERHLRQSGLFHTRVSPRRSTPHPKPLSNWNPQNSPIPPNNLKSSYMKLHVRPGNLADSVGKCHYTPPVPQLCTTEITGSSQKGQVHMLDFAGHHASVSASKCCLCHAKAARAPGKQRAGCIPQTYGWALEWECYITFILGV